jgi:hypothetical protein
MLTVMEVLPTGQNDRKITPLTPPAAGDGWTGP